MFESLIVRGRNTENCLQKRNSVRLTKWKLPPASTPRGPLRGSVSVSSVSQLRDVTALSFDLVGISEA